MQIGMVGLGRMGGNMVRRLMAKGHECVGYNRNPAPRQQLAAEGMQPAAALEELVAALTTPRAVWLMLPAAVTGGTVETLSTLLEAGDTIIDGGNSYYRDDVDRAEAMAAHGIHYVDCGTSGGVWGRDRGYCLMIGGEQEPVARLDPIFAALAPGVEAAPRTPGRSGEPSQPEHGYLHCGPPGAGHFVKMVHNGIEYAIMGSYAEGLNVIRGAGVGKQSHEVDAETAPLADPRYYQYDEINLADVAEVWRRGSVVGSWLLDLTATALAEDPKLSQYSGRVSDSGEGRWTAIAAVEEGVPAPLMTDALFGRFSSRGNDEFANKVMSAQRKLFGGHDEKPTA